jgi:hypothetical protein
MGKKVIQDWTDSTVLLKFGDTTDVRYQVYRDDTGTWQEIRTPDNALIHSLELPDGLAMEERSYEVLLRYVLLELGGDESAPGKKH